MLLIKDFTRNLLMVVLTALIISFLIEAVAFAASTISTNISTGGTLTVTGASTLTGDVTASGALAVTGASTLTGNVTAAGTLAVTGATTLTGLATMNGGATTTHISTTGNVLVNGWATTTGSNGNIATLGSLGVGTSTEPATGVISANSNIGIASSTPGQELGVIGDAIFSSSATTTIRLHSTGAGDGFGGCIEMLGSDGTTKFRMYATSSGMAWWDTGSCQ